METKIWISDYGYDKTLHGFEKSAQARSRPDRPVDLAPSAAVGFRGDPGRLPALETLLADGKVSHQGQQLHGRAPTTLLGSTVVPAVNQIEVHPYFQQRDVQALNAERGILTRLVPSAASPSTATGNQPAP